MSPLRMALCWIPGLAATLLAIDQGWRLVQNLTARSNEFLIRRSKLSWSKQGDTVAILEGQFDSKMLLQRTTHGIAGKHT